MTQLVFYDSECATCHGLVRFLLRREERERFRFIPIKELTNTHVEKRLDTKGRAIKGDSIVVRDQGRFFQKSDAVFVILSSLRGRWRILEVFRIVPRKVLDWFYDLFARNRYAIFGKANPNALCELPDPALRKLLLDQIPCD